MLTKMRALEPPPLARTHAGGGGGGGGPQDETTPTGGRVVYPPEAMPVDRDGVTFSPEAWSRQDGFPTSTAAMTFFANLSLEASGVPGWTDLAASLRDDCPTLLIDTVTGEHLPHFAELDYSSEVRLDASHRVAARPLGSRRSAGATPGLPIGDTPAEH